jgi:hypothetical protein
MDLKTRLLAAWGQASKTQAAIAAFFVGAILGALIS